jgi:ADP-ribosyl-[dinitrogen reductase] hydrolase
MRHRNDLMLLRIAQADAYALAREYVKTSGFPEHVAECLKFERFLQHPSYLKMKPGAYSDDTQMSIALAELLRDDASGLFWDSRVTAETFARYFFNAFKRDPRDGYSRGFQQILEEAKDPTHMRSLIVPSSTKNGAAMRAVPIGVLPCPQKVAIVAGMQATVTHATYEGINSAVAVALMSHFALYDRRPFSCLRGWCIQYCPVFEHFSQPWVGPVQSRCDHSSFDVGLNTAWAVCTLLEQETSLMAIMRQLLKWGGDTDSVAAVAWGIASCRYKDEVLPEFLERDLEPNSRYGVSFLKDLGKQLMDSYDTDQRGL